METSTLMMIFFIIFLAISIWKIYAFLPSKQLSDDDTTKEAQETLRELMIKIMEKNSSEIDNKKLFELMISDAEFNKEKFWRFNQNKLNNLLSNYKQEAKR
ncbi:hypothetical protein Suden_0510 [Sulfurimonas denitrificans DSM 1251]|jgi:hypothetical protein|uniref:Uncharacterized protein n=1 Tax=Sulfurimonas denitrificans (strain ATCC 33889 / DSM 1251) TaxID=326298 RepID=Q30T91_SULDN|nr:hypothetical protein [Sulfurimonas denitrificans]ABB43790.1 hypothetical protein Suden_0510 [Sulfurimonas denitrificans DSM 1251]MDD3442461.1 hypothetical protein [Sulfurimonas denitrificans]